MIAHLDADSFFASVLVRKHPNLRGKPLLAVGMGGGCVIAATYEAKAYGVKTGMRLSEARKLVPGAIEMPADFKETCIASQQIESILKNICPIVEQMSIDEWFLDLSSLVGGNPRHPETWARETRESILKNTALSMSVGVAPSKLLAKMASEYRKPGGVTIITVSRDDPLGRLHAIHQDAPAERLYEKPTKMLAIEEFLKDRPAAAIPGIGRQRSLKTDAAGIVTAWDLAEANDDLLISLCGRPGVEMKRELLGEQVFPVTKDTRPPQSISRCRTFRSTLDQSLLKAHLLKHLEYCTMKMRRQHLVCREISVHLRTAAYEYRGAHRRFDQPLSTVSQMMPAAFSALEELIVHEQPRQRINQIGLALHGLSPAGITQSSIFEDSATSASDERVQAAVDRLHTRFGRDSLTRGTALSVSSGVGRDLSIPDV